MMRGFRNVNPKGVGLYATSEGAWIASYVVQRGRAGRLPGAAFAHGVLRPARTRIPRRAGLRPCRRERGVPVDSAPRVLARPAGPGIDERRPQHIGAGRLPHSHPRGLWGEGRDDRTGTGLQRHSRTGTQSRQLQCDAAQYPIANHVLRLGDEAMENTPFADDYMRDDRCRGWPAPRGASHRQASPLQEHRSTSRSQCRWNCIHVLR